MRLFRYACAGLATSVLAASAFTGPASAQAAGVGTSLTTTRLLTAQLGEGGSLLDLALLTDEARSTIDSAVASPEAYSRLTALAAKASLVPGSPVNVTEGVYEAKSTGPTEVPIANSSIAVPALPVDVPLALAPVLSATVDPGKLTASLNQGVAAATMSSQVSQVKAVGGLLGLGSLQSALDASSGATSSGATRGASVNDLTVLDLGALLAGLGLPLDQLTPLQLAGLIDALAVQTGVPLPSGTDTVTSAITALDAAIDDLQATLTAAPAAVGEITTGIDGATSTLVGAVGTATGVTLPLPSTGQTLDQAIAAVNLLIDELQALLADLLTEGLLALDGLALLRLEGVEVGVTTKAAETVAGSVATVTGKIGAIKVGNVTLPGIDLLGGDVAAAAVGDDVAAAIAGLNTQLGTVLATIDPSLANLVKVSVLDQATSITQEGGYTKSRAGLTAATATVTPPADLAALVDGILADTGVAETLTAAGAPVPTVDGLMDTLQTTLGLPDLTNVLASPAKVQIA